MATLTLTFRDGEAPGTVEIDVVSDPKLGSGDKPTSAQTLGLTACHLTHEIIDAMGVKQEVVDVDAPIVKAPVSF